MKKEGEEWKRRRERREERERTEERGERREERERGQKYANGGGTHPSERRRHPRVIF